MENSFTVEINNLHYNITSYCDDDCTHYEVSTNCEKLFTLKKGSDGVWKTNENDIVPINQYLIDDIGNAIEQHLIF